MKVVATRGGTLEVGFLLQRAHRGLRQAQNEALRSLNLTIAHAAVLGLLGERGNLSQRRLAETLGADKSTMVNLVDELERQGLAERRPNPADRRAHAVQLTEAGRRRLTAAGVVVKGVQDAFLAPLSKRDQAQLQRLLERLAGERTRPAGDRRKPLAGR